jgi:ATP-binding cassette subfamily B protein
MKNGIWNNYRGKLTSIIAGNVLTNIPRGFFNGVIYLMILGLTIPLIKGESIDYSLLERYYLYYLIAFLVYIVFSIFSSINTFAKSYVIGSDIRMRLGEKLRKLSLGFFKSNDPGDVTSRMLHDVDKAEETLSHYLIDYINGLIIPILIGSFLLYLEWRLSIVLLATVAIAFLFFFIGKRIINVMGKKHLEIINSASSRILEYTSSIKVLKSFNMVGENFEELDKVMLKLKKLSFRTEVWTGIPIQIALLIIDLGYLFTIFIGAKMCINNTMTIANLFTVTILGYYFFEPVKQLGISIVLLRHAKNSLDRIEEIFEEEEPSYVAEAELPRHHNFSFNNVKFKYKDNLVLDGLNCVIPEKQMTALVGVSGSGKTTMTNLLARFWDAQEGTITYGGKDIKEYKPEILLKHISMVFQDVFLFNDTIINNIRIGNKDASDADVIKAATLAQCHNFISELPSGYNTMVSEAGRSLSGGEKQRISIARAILKDAPVILLDEATASLDPENENEIQIALDNLVEDKTLIVIAHKFSSILNADQILVLENGKIKESGTHSQLLHNKGLYNKLWSLQLEAGSWMMKQ